MAWEIDQFLREIERLGEARLGWIEAEAPHLVGLRRLRRPAPQRAGKRRNRVFGQAKDFADLADRTAAAIADDGGCEPRPIAAIVLVDVLDDLFASFVLEIDIDIRRLATLGR